MSRDLLAMMFVAVMILCLTPILAAQLSFIEPLATPLTFPTGGEAIGVAQGDFNGDGILDLAVTQQSNIGGLRGFVSIMLGNGDGTFQPPLNIPLPGGGCTILAKDIDNDGKLDLVVEECGIREVLFFKGHGDGTFNNPMSIGTVGPAVGIQAADFNNDGNPDLATINSDNTVTVLLGNGDGTFRPPAIYRITGSNPQDLAIGDLDGRNGSDIIVGCYNSQSVEVLLNNGDGTFPAATTSFSARLQVLGVYVGDFDQDGKQDLVVAGYNGPAGGRSLGLIKGNGDGTLQFPPDTNFQATEDSPGRRYSENVTYDLNGDGIPDVLWTRSGVGLLNMITVALGRGDGQFIISEWVAAPADGTSSRSVVVGDFNGDGVPDLAVTLHLADNAPPGTTGVSVMLGVGGGAYLAPMAAQLSSRPAGGSGVFASSGDYWMVLGDFNNDGNTDTVAITSSPGFGGSLDFLAGRGNGTFAPPVQMIIGGGCPADDVGPFSPPIRAADINNDGNVDIAMKGFINIPTSIHCVSGINIGYGNGDGTFTRFAASSRSDWQGYTLQNLYLADFNGDGFLDLAVTRYNGVGTILEVYLWPFNTHIETIDGTDRAVLDVSYSSGFLSRADWGAITGGDVNNDGKLDLILHADADGSGPERLLVFKGNGDGTFSESDQANLGFPPIQDFKTADLNQDGSLDLIGVIGRDVFVALGNGDGTFQPPTHYQLPSQAGISAGTFADIVDLNGDGFLDLTVAMAGASVAVLPGKGDGTFGPALQFAVGDNLSRNVNVADLNGDGKPDLVVGRPTAPI